MVILINCILLKTSVYNEIHNEIEFPCISIKTPLSQKSAKKCSGFFTSLLQRYLFLKNPIFLFCGVHNTI